MSTILEQLDNLKLQCALCDIKYAIIGDFGLRLFKRLEPTKDELNRAIIGKFGNDYVEYIFTYDYFLQFLFKIKNGIERLREGNPTPDGNKLFLTYFKDSNFYAVTTFYSKEQLLSLTKTTNVSYLLMRLDLYD